MNTTEVDAPRVGQRPWLALAATVVGAIMVGLDGTAVTIAAPYVARDVHATLPELEFIANAYLIALAVGLLPAGRVADRIGRRTTFMIGVLGFGFSSVGIAFSGSVTALIVFRAIQGLAGALLQPAALALLRTAFDGKRLPLALGVWSGVNALAIGLGPVLAGVIVEYLDWPAIFLINLPIGIIAAVSALFAVQESHARDATVFSSLRTLLTHRTVLVTGAVIALSSFGIFGLLFMLTLYLQNVLGLSPIVAGLWILGPTATVVFSALIGGALGERFGPRWPMSAGLLFVGCGIFGVAGAGQPAGYWQLVLPALGVGIGTGLCVVPATNALLAAAGERLTGIASAVQQAGSQFGGLLGIALLGTVLSSTVAGAVPAGTTGVDDIAQGMVPHGVSADVAHTAFTSGMNIALIAAAGITVLGALGTALLARR
ncbi:MFS transporter [Sciscionella marina]|uniref:MFS transporter n=1 Tax=Sciscionella marina TaxID=508770 RepID=UPI0003800ACD|nr:MFS transporter [Sciscionella marina]